MKKYKMKLLAVFVIIFFVLAYIPTINASSTKLEYRKKMIREFWINFFSEITNILDPPIVRILSDDDCWCLIDENKHKGSGHFGDEDPPDPPPDP